MRCAIVDSGTRNDRAICTVVRPATARRVSATCDGGLRDGWRHSSITARVSSQSTDVFSGSAVAKVLVVTSRVTRLSAVRERRRRAADR